ncbi:hypothetical protein NUW58_g7133 [Xylaria curta]|uniref:Uncharacterized protein n=1 Tax=Xylaria curta TaxID=42375 RepID=A0ACC1NKA3_9PEZI|nr:hypothetical protein NUW58_g7133 [Xylaria curta]
MAVTPIPRKLDSQTIVPAFTDEAIHNHPSEPGPATGGRFYKEDKQHPSVVFRFCPDPSRFYHFRCQDWIACLEVKCFDVPRLMREGFHWDASNVIKEDGYIEHGKEGPVVDVLTSASKRWYFLTDTNQPRRWIATLSVMALDFNTLYNFNLNQLSRELVRSAWALNQDQQKIYGYQAHTSFDEFSNTAESPAVGFNIIYDKMPMGGFWPWPQQENEPHTKDHADSRANEKVASGSPQPHSFQHIARSKENLIDVECPE